MSRHNKGFTLIELLVVIGIIGILSTIAAVSFTGAQGKARDAKRLADVRGLQTALELYAADRGGYPSTATSISITNTSSLSLSSAAAGFTAPASATAPVYLAQVPTPPSNATTYAYYGWDNNTPTAGAKCTSGIACTGYRILFGLESPTPDYPNAVCGAATCPANKGIVATPTATVDRTQASLPAVAW